MPEWTEADAARDELRLPEVVQVGRMPNDRMLVEAVSGTARALARMRGAVRPASVIREKLRGSFDDRLVLLEDIADGECVAKMQVGLAEVLPSLACPSCQAVGMVVREGSGVKEIEVRASATPKERLVALDILAKYGLGQLKEVSVENVRERVSRTVALARQMLGPDVAEQFVAGMRPIWKDG